MLKISEKYLLIPIYPHDKTVNVLKNHEYEVKPTPIIFILLIDSSQKYRVFMFHQIKLRLNNIFTTTKNFIYFKVHIENTDSSI